MGHPTLRLKAKPLQKEDLTKVRFKNLLSDMVDTLRDYGGVGLAAPQINESLRVVIIEIRDKNLRYGVPAYEGDILFATSEVLGVEVKKDGASNGSVQVKTTITNQDSKVVLEYVRQVLVRASKGKTLNTQSTIQDQPDRIGLTEAMMPLKFQNLPKKFNDENVKAYEDFGIDETYEGTFSKSISLVDFSWLQISTLNDASVHHTPGSNFIGYGLSLIHI